MGQEKENAIRLEAFKEYQINTELVKSCEIRLFIYALLTCTSRGRSDCRSDRRTKFSCFPPSWKSTSCSKSGSCGFNVIRNKPYHVGIAFEDEAIPIIMYGKAAMNRITLCLIEIITSKRSDSL